MALGSAFGASLGSPFALFFGGAPPPDWAALMASTSWAFFMLPEPEMPMLPAICLRSAISMELSPPPRFLGAAPLAEAASWPEVEDSMVSVT